jgi:hypothetical protein
MLIQALRFANDGFLDQALRDAEGRPTAHSQLLRLIELSMPSDPADEPHSQWLLWLDVWARSPRNPTVDAHRRDLEGHWIAAYERIIRRGQQAARDLRGHDPGRTRRQRLGGAGPSKRGPAQCRSALRAWMPDAGGDWWQWDGHDEHPRCWI